MTWLAGERDRLDGFRRGDREILSEVYRRYAPEVSRLLGHGFSFQSAGQHFRFFGFPSPSDLDDVVQETFVRALSDSARAAYDGLRPFQNYLMSIARNLVIDHHRSRGRQERCFARIDVEQEPETPERSALEKELRTLLAGFKEQLGEEERLLFELRFEQRTTRQRVQQMTGLSPMKIRTREKHLRTRLYELLRARGYGPVGAAVLTVLCLAAVARMVP